MGRELGQLRQCGADPLRALPRGPLAGGYQAPVRRAGVGVELVPQRRHVACGVALERDEAVGPAVRVPARRRPHPDPVLGDPGERHEAFRREGGDTRGQQAVEQLAVINPEVGQGVVVDRDAATDPAVRVVRVAQAFECPRRADVLERGVQL